MVTNPALTKGLSISGGNLLVNGAPPVAPVSQNAQTANALTSSLVKPTTTGGMTFHPAAAAAYNKPVAPTVPVATPSGLSQYIGNTVPSTNGGSLSTVGGQPNAYSAGPGFSIDPTGAVPSSALTSYANPQQTHNKYSDYVNTLAQAQGYSPEYIAAQNAQFGAQAQGAQLSLNEANINNQFYNGGPNIPGGATVDYLSGITAKAQSQNTLSKAANSIQQLSANQALTTQQLSRTGDIAAAGTQLQYSPTAVAGKNAIDQYNTLQQQYPNAGIPAYDPNGDPLQQQQLAQSLVAASPAYQAGFTSTYQNAQGGTDILNKLSLGALQKNTNGTYSLVNGVDAVIGEANKNTVTTQAAIYSNIDAALTSFNKTAASTVNFMSGYQLNQSNVPIINQLQNAINAKTAPAGALAAFKIDVTNLQNDYAAFLTARNGSVAGTNQEAANTINIDTLSPSQMQIVFQQMQTDGKNTQTGALEQIQKATQGLRTNTAASSISSGGSVGSSWDNL